MSLAGIRKLNGRSIGFIFLGDPEQRNFTVTVKERAYGDEVSKTIIQRHALSANCLSTCKGEVHAAKSEHVRHLL